MVKNDFIIYNLGGKNNKLPVSGDHTAPRINLIPHQKL